MLFKIDVLLYFLKLCFFFSEMLYFWSCMFSDIVFPFFIVLLCFVPQGHCILKVAKHGEQK